MSDPTSKPHIAQTLLLNSHPPQIASTIFSEKVLQKRLVVRGASPDPTSHDARAQRRLQRLRAKEKKTARSNSKSKSKAEVEKEVEKEKENEKEKKPKPLSARQKRVSGIYKIPPSKQKYEIYRGLNRMWVGYMWEILGLVRVDDDDHGGQGQGRGEWVRGGGGGGGGKATAYVTAQSAGNVLASADFHGAEVMVVRSRCVGMVGLKGIVVRDTKFTFQVITKGDRLKTIPKRYTVFRFEIEQPSAEQPSAQHPQGDGTTVKDNEAKLPNLVFELYGSQFENRAPDRATKKFKAKHLGDL